MDFSTPVASPSWLEVEARTSDHATWITIRGEADVSNHEQLEAALSAVEVDGADRVYLQLSELGFCDVGTLYRLLKFAQEVSANHCDVVAVDANPLVQLMTRLLAVDEELRFEPLPVGSEG